MHRPVLLWVDLQVSESAAEPLALFGRHCDVRHASGDVTANGDGPRPDIICLDFDYPDMAALKLIPETKKRYPSVPLVMLTLQHSEELAVWAFRARVFDYLVKPICDAEVARCMERLTEALQARNAQHGRRFGVIREQAPTEVRYQRISSAQTKLQPAVAYIIKHFARRIAEPEVAELCGLSPFRFSREFKAAFGLTFQEYLVNHRIAQAKRLLANPTVSITDVAMMIGFNDPSYFARVFKRQTGISPTEYRDSPPDEAVPTGPAAAEPEALLVPLPLPVS